MCAGESPVMSGNDCVTLCSGWYWLLNGWWNVSLGKAGDE